jgi:hypothetical protein
MRWNVAWIVATTIGLVVGGVMFHFPGSFDELSWQLPALVVGAVIGFVSGLFVGMVQWAALQLQRRAGLRLLLWMATGVAVTHGLHDGAPWSIGNLAISVTCGVAMAGTYAACFEDRRPIPLLLIGLGWAGGLLVAHYGIRILPLPEEETPVAWATAHAAEALIVALVWGVITVIAGVPARLRADLPTLPPRAVVAEEAAA